MKRLFIDIETRADESIRKLPSVYKYCEHLDPEYPILLFGYSRDEEPVQVVDLANGETIPIDVLEALQNNDVEKYAFNAQFERVVLSKGLFHLPGAEFLDPESWHCIATLAAECGFPMQLEACGSVMGLDKQKLSSGKELIPMFCQKTVSPQISIFDEDISDNSLFSGANWEDFKKYNIRDVEAEIEIWKRCQVFKIKAWETEHKYYVMDQRINDAGFLIDIDLANTCRSLAAENINSLAERLTELTGLANPRSNTEMKKYLASRGITLTDNSKSGGNAEEKATLDGTAIALTLKRDDLDDDLREILTLYGQITKTSSSKYDAMLKAASDYDYRARGCFVFYGASTTGRFSGKAVQLQNPTKNGPDIYDLHDAAEAGPDGLREYSDKVGRPVSSLMSELVRTAIVPKDGYKFIDMDYSQIEARVLAWFANEEWRLKTFEEGKDIYSESASQALGIPVAKHGPNAGKRKVGKLLELACGYGGGNGALVRFLTKIYLTPTAVDGLDTDGKRNQMVTAWRNASPNIKSFWYKTDEALKQAFHNPGTKVEICRDNRRDPSKAIPPLVSCMYSEQHKCLALRLPSGRNLLYQDFKVIPVTVMRGGVETKTEQILYSRYEKGRWSVNDRVYGATFVENIVQAAARDLLCDAMLRIEALNKDPELIRAYQAFYKQDPPETFIQTVASIHDEAVVEAPEGIVDLCFNKVKQIMSEPPSWTFANPNNPAQKALPITADGDVLDFFCKPDDVIIPDKVLKEREMMKELSQSLISEPEETKYSSQVMKLFKQNGPTNEERS